MYLWGNTWSSSIKRQLVSGAAVLVPEPNPHETYITVKLSRGCPGCVIPVDPARLCESSEAQLGNLSDSDLARKGAETAAFARRTFSNQALLAYMNATLTSLASSGVPFPATAAAAARSADGNTQVPEILNLEGKRLRLITCQGLKQMHRENLGKGRAWQVDEWYDDVCDLKFTGYLRYTSI